MNNDEILIPFLRNLADSLESKALLPNQVQKIGEFFMAYQLENPDNNENFSREEMIKFFTLGWYVYKHLLDNSEAENNNIT